MTNASRTSGICAVAALCLFASASGALAENPGNADCVQVGTWLEPASGKALAPERLLADMAKRSVVLLGESHDNAEHHRWQLHSLAALHAHNPNMVIGFEMFPRRVQPALDAWVAGEHDVKGFLEAANWREVWGFYEGLYLPLFHFARQNRIPMVALNVERSLISKVGREGWDAVPAEEREGVSDPASASQGYRESLAGVYAAKQVRASQTLGHQEEGQGADEAPDLDEVMEREDFQRFVQAQLTWDRAMAEALATARKERPEALVVGIVGRGHMEHRYGIPHQLAELGIADSAVLIPVEAEAACNDLAADLADGVFVVARSEEVETERPRPRLGVFIETTDQGVRVNQVVEGSVADATELAQGDIVMAAAGLPVADVSELIEIVQRQAPGTWLPLKVKRGEEEIEFVAKFPTETAE